MKSINQFQIFSRNQKVRDSILPHCSVKRSILKARHLVTFSKIVIFLNRCDILSYLSHLLLVINSSMNIVIYCWKVSHNYILWRQFMFISFFSALRYIFLASKHIRINITIYPPHSTQDKKFRRALIQLLTSEQGSQSLSSFSRRESVPLNHRLHPQRSIRFGEFGFFANIVKYLCKNWKMYIRIHQDWGG